MRRLTIGLLFTMAAAILVTSCGSSTIPQDQNQPPGLAPLTIFGADAPACSVLSFEVTISGATLTPEGGGPPVEIISPGDSLRVDFAALMGFNTVLNLTSVPAGTYTEINLTLADPQLTVLGGTPPAPTTIPATFTQASVTAPIEPRLVVTADTPAGLILDFLLLRSLETDANGDVTGVVDPMFRVLPSVITTLRRMGDFDDLRGIVQSVNTTSSNPAFLGSFTLQRRHGRTLLIQVTNQTQFENVSGLEGLTAGLFVEVEGFVDADGNIVAQEVEAHEQTDTTSAIFVGPVISVTRDGSGNATSFTIWVREEFPDVSLTVPRRTPLTVNLTPETRFGISAFGRDLGSFFFHPGTLGVGQRVAVHGPFTAGDPPSVTASRVVLRPQPLLGNFQSVLAVGSDGKTGGFALVPCNRLFQGQTVTVLTAFATRFEGFADLNGLSTTKLYLVRGYVLYEQTPGSLNGVSWNPPPPVYVMLAGLVRELDLP